MGWGERRACQGAPDPGPEKRRAANPRVERKAQHRARLEEGEHEGLARRPGQERAQRAQEGLPHGAHDGPCAGEERHGLSLGRSDLLQHLLLLLLLPLALLALLPILRLLLLPLLQLAVVAVAVVAVVVVADMASAIATSVRGGAGARLQRPVGKGHHGIHDQEEPLYDLFGRAVVVVVVARAAMGGVGQEGEKSESRRQSSGRLAGRAAKRAEGERPFRDNSPPNCFFSFLFFFFLLLPPLLSPRARSGPRTRPISTPHLDR